MKSATDFLKMISYGCGCCDGRGTKEIDEEIISVIQKAMNQARKEALEDAAKLVSENAKIRFYTHPNEIMRLLEKKPVDDPK